MPVAIVTRSTATWNPLSSNDRRPSKMLVEMGISRGTVVELAALLGEVVPSNAEMDQLLFRYGFEERAPATIRLKAPAPGRS